MAEFTTEKRRDLTRSGSLVTDDATLQTMNQQFDLAYSNEVKKDKTNNEIFRTINSELTGLAYEYRYLNGKYHATLDEVEIEYIGLDNDGEQYITKSYWDNLKLQTAANLEAGNEFHLNIREGTTVSYPIRPEKYASWVADIHEDVYDFDATEDNLIAMIGTLDSWYTSGGGSGSVETTISGEYLEQIIDIPDTLQPYMPVGYTAYQGDDTDGYMTSGYNKDNEIVLINGSDPYNFAFGKIVNSRDLPSRILFVPYGRIGTIPDDAVITSTFSAETPMITRSAIQVIATLETFYRMARHYLEYNPNSADAANEPTLTGLNSIIDLIEIWENVTNKTDFSIMTTLISAISAIRDPLKAARITYINSHLGEASSLYTDRFDVLDLRLSKVGGTLKELMTNVRGTGIINAVLQEQSNASEWYSNFFIVKVARKNGEWYRRLFVDDFTPGPDTLEVGQTCYILSDDENVPEIEAEITHIVDGRLVDMLNSTYDEKGNSDIAYIACKKIFFKGVIFSKKYLMSDALRIIRQI